ncbi:MAG: complex I NDUFA9 subunit family protein [Sphingomonadaceae bacterium]|nr:complex I NDUFA9 subunit family protein [Sphingomonadaceae bacterium]
MSTSERNELSGKAVTVLGGGGFLGKHLAQELLSRGARLRIADRHPDRAFRLKPLGDLGQVAFMHCDVTRPETLGPALRGSDAVINLVGAFKGDLDAIQGIGAGRVAKAAAEAGVGTFIHVSAIGADASSSVDYARTKAEGEEAVRAAFPKATIVRPSLLFGPDDNFVQMFAGLIARFPALPVFAPDAKLQPVFVDDAAEAIGALLSDPAKYGGKTIELGGPEVITVLELNQRIANAQGHKRGFIELPDGVSSAFATLTGWLPGAPITSDQFTLLSAGNVVSGKRPGFKALGITPRPLSLFLDRWMIRFRKHGRFTQQSA